MTASFVSNFRNPIPAGNVADAAASARATLKRGVAGGVGTLWERVEETGARLVTFNGWLCEVAGGCTCGMGNAHGHERGCGLEPLYHFDKPAVPSSTGGTE